MIAYYGNFVVNNKFEMSHGICPDKMTSLTKQWPFPIVHPKETWMKQTRSTAKTIIFLFGNLQNSRISKIASNKYYLGKCCNTAMYRYLKQFVISQSLDQLIIADGKPNVHRLQSDNHSQRLEGLQGLKVKNHKTD